MAEHDNHTIRSRVLKTLLFILLVCIVVFLIQKPFKIEDPKMFQHIEGFYQEKDNSLDAIYVGASNVYPWYEPPTAWHNYGIRTYDLSTPGMPARAVRYVVEEALKTQPDSLYIFNLNNYKNKTIGFVRIHNIADHFHLSRVKLDMINDLAEHSDIELKDRLEFVFPMLRFHSGWSELTTTDFVRKVNGLKGGETYGSFLTVSVDQTANIAYSDKREKPRDYRKENLSDLVEFLKEKKVKALFVFLPQAVKNSEYVGEMNSLADYVQEEGFDVLNLLDEKEDFDEVGLDFRVDFKDPKHVNVHGAEKYTKYIAGYIQKKYKFEDKREQPGNSDWDKAADMYFEAISPYTLDIERELTKRTLDLDRPGSLGCEVKGTSINVSWSPVEGADAYAVYRKMLLLKKGTVTTSWERIAVTENGGTSYTDEGLRKHKTYFYTVVPIKYENGEPVYGCFDYKGVSKKTEE